MNLLMLTVSLAMIAKTLTPDRSSMPWEEVENERLVINHDINMTCTGTIF